jgi:hypothetical protein
VAPGIAGLRGQAMPSLGANQRLQRVVVRGANAVFFVDRGVIREGTEIGAACLLRVGIHVGTGRTERSLVAVAQQELLASAVPDIADLRNHLRAQALVEC